MIVTNVILTGDSYQNGRKILGFASAQLENGPRIYVGACAGFGAAHDECDRLGHDTTRIRERTEEWIKTGVMPPHNTNG